MSNRKPGPADTADDAPTRVNLNGCRRCELWEPATQGVPGEGRIGAGIMLVGEQRHVAACHVWLEKELAMVRPAVIVATYHPSAVLRVPDEEARNDLRAMLLADLNRAARVARRNSKDA